MNKEIAADGREITWRYTLILRETAGRTVQFKSHVQSMERRNLSPYVNESAFERRLSANSELRVPWSFRVYTATGGQRPVERGDPLEVWHSLRGKDDSGKDVRVDARFRLD